MGYSDSLAAGCLAKQLPSPGALHQQGARGDQGARPESPRAAAREESWTPGTAAAISVKRPARAMAPPSGTAPASMEDGELKGLHYMIGWQGTASTGGSTRAENLRFDIS